MATSNTKTYERSCIACGKKAPKRSLLRIVRTTGNAVAFDASGNMPGRGAYVCSPECFNKAKDARLARALKTNITPESALEIERAIQVAQV